MPPSLLFLAPSTLPLPRRIPRVSACPRHIPRLSLPRPHPHPHPTPLSAPRILRNLYAFSRPHTLHATTLSVISLHYLAHLHTAVAPFASLSASLPPALLLNIFIVGLNQLTDVPLDRINKPYLPLASGAMSTTDALAVIIFSLVAGLSFCFHPAATPALRVVLVGSALLGTMYSAPPFRLKRFALLASLAIFVVRGLLINVCFYLHAAAATSLPPLLIFASAFFTVFGIVIALLKDVPDIRGDRLYGIRTFSVRIGAKAIFSFCTRLLISIFLASSLVYIRIGTTPLRFVGALVHVAGAMYLQRASKQVKPADPSAVYSFYMRVWNLFYLEYLLLPLAL